MMNRTHADITGRWSQSIAERLRVDAVQLHAIGRRTVASGPAHALRASDSSRLRSNAPGVTTEMYGYSGSSE
jgi:hypothetical protein